VRLGCPCCSQAYHSPELLSVHYKCFHSKKDDNKADVDGHNEEGGDGRATLLENSLRNVRILREGQREDAGESPPPSKKASLSRRQSQEIHCEVFRSCKVNID